MVKFVNLIIFELKWQIKIKLSKKWYCVDNPDKTFDHSNQLISTEAFDNKIQSISVNKHRNNFHQYRFPLTVGEKLNQELKNYADS